MWRRKADTAFLVFDKVIRLLTFNLTCSRTQVDSTTQATKNDNIHNPCQALVLPNVMLSLAS